MKLQLIISNTALQVGGTHNEKDQIMAQSGFTPIQIYASSTTGNVPATGNLTNNASGSEVAINITDGKLFYKDNIGAIQVIATKAAAAGIPSGAVFHFAMVTAPSGYLECNGSAVSRTTYASLFAAIGTVYGIGDGTTTFNLPDLRGQFLRGWDNGRGVDTGRVFGSSQTSAYTNHAHTASSSTSVSISDPTHQHNYLFSGYSSGQFTVTGGVGANANINQLTDAASTGITASGSTATTVNTSTTGATETRPVNVAMLPCIKT